MRYSILCVLLVLGCLALSPVPSCGQAGAFAVQFRAGTSTPVGELRSADKGWNGGATAGPSWGMGFTFPIPGPFGAFVGFGQRHFDCLGSVCPDDSDWVSTGFDTALRLVLGSGQVRPWLIGGMHSHRIEGRIYGYDNEIRRISSDGGGGFEMGAGVMIGVGERTSLSPGVRFGWSEVPFPDRQAILLRYLIIDVGLVLGF